MKNNQNGFSYIEILLLVVIAGLISFVGWYVLRAKTNADLSLNEAAKSQTLIKSATKKPLSQSSQVPTASSITKSSKGTSSSLSTKAGTPAKTTTISPTPTPAPNPTPNTTNCLPPNPSPYATYYIGMTNSQYLQTNSYVHTTKLYAALQFAGLIDTINTKQYVVLAMDDTGWNSFTQSQLNWMNASPTNMRSVLGWQIITSCITWNGVNPVKDIPAGTTQSVNTLNGSVTFTSQANGNGTFGNGTVGIWDWFTSNGSVTIAGFVNTSSIP